MNICISLLWDFIFGILGYIWKNPISVTLVGIGIIGIAKRMGIFIGILLMVIDFLKDTVDIGTFGLATPLTILVSLGIGFGWAAMAFNSNAPRLIALANSIPMFIFGTIIGIVQLPFLAVIHLIAGFGMKNRIISSLMGIFSIAVLYFVLSFTFTIISGFCQGLQYAISLF